MTTKERLNDLERRVINLEMKLQTRLVKKAGATKKEKPQEKNKGKNKK